MTRPIVASALASALAAAAVAALPGAARAEGPVDSGAAARPAEMSQADLLLAAIEIPFTHEVIARAGLTEALATARLTDVSARRYIRLRALSSLPFFGTPSARALVEATARADADLEVRIQAVTSLARGFGPRDPVGVLSTLRTLSRGAPPRLGEAIAAEVERLAPAGRPDNTVR